MMADWRNYRERSAVLGRWLEPPIYPVENNTNQTLHHGNYVYLLYLSTTKTLTEVVPKNKSGLKNDGVLLGCTVLHGRGGSV